MFFVLKGNELIKKKIQRVWQKKLTKNELEFIKLLLKNNSVSIYDAMDIFDFTKDELDSFVANLHRKTDLYITLKGKRYYLETPISYIY